MTQTQMDTQSSLMLETEGLLTLCDKSNAYYKKKALDLFDKIAEHRKMAKKAHVLKRVVRDLRVSIRNNGNLSEDETKKLNEVKEFLTLTN